MNRCYFYLSLVLSFFFLSTTTSAQCSAGQNQVYIQIETDDYGYEGYWELVPAGNPCGTGTIFSGGNSAQVGCNGAGQRDATAGNGYGNNATPTEGPWCLAAGQDYDIIYIDDYGDGGFTFHVEVEGFEIATFTGDAGTQRYTFTADPPPAYDAAISEVSTPSYGSFAPVVIKGEVVNTGQTTMNSATLNYQKDNDPVVSQTFTFLPTAFGNSYEFTFSTPIIVNDTNEVNLRVWVSEINGQPDQNSSNNELTKVLAYSAPIPNLLSNFITEGFTNTVVATAADNLNSPRDLDFHPDLKRKELWVVNQDSENTGGSTLTIRAVGTANEDKDWRRDGNAWHFMSMPTGLAFSDNGNFATSPGVQDANHSGGTFTGPTLWSSDPAIYAIHGNPPTAQDNGSHLDMLHGSPYSMGIAHERDNVFWIFDTYYEDLVRYDFLEDHGPGQHYHGDGDVRRVTELQAQRFNTRVPSHMVLDKQSGWLYIADAKNARVTRVQIYSGNVKGNLPLINEPLATHEEMENVTIEQFITSGLTRPSGIELLGTNLLVGDYQTGEIVIYDISGASASEIGRIATGATELMGIKVGPDGNIWFVDAGTNELRMLKANEPSVGIEDLAESAMELYPNPTSDRVALNLPADEGTVSLYNLTGQVVKTESVNSFSMNIDLSGLSSGVYLVEWNNGEQRLTKKLIKQ